MRYQPFLYEQCAKCHLSTKNHNKKQTVVSKHSSLFLSHGLPFSFLAVIVIRKVLEHRTSSCFPGRITEQSKTAARKMVQFKIQLVRFTQFFPLSFSFSVVLLQCPLPLLFAIALLHCSSPFLLHLLLHCPSAVPVLFCRILILAVLVWQSLKTTWTSSGRLIQPSERKYNDYFEKCNTLIKNFIKSCSLFFIYCSSDGNTSTTHGPYYPRILLNAVPSAGRRYGRFVQT